MKRAVKAEDLELIARDIRPDTKHRLALGKALAGLDDEVRFDVYRNERGQILLDPQVSVPAAEVWLYRNPEALAAVRRGLAEAAEGKATRVGSFADYVHDDE